MNTRQRYLAIIGSAVLAPLACPAQLLTTQEAGFFSAAFWAANLPTLDLNPSGGNNGTVPLPGSPAFGSGATFNNPFLLSGGVIDIVWFSETAGWTQNDLYLTLVQPGSTTELIVDNSVAPNQPKFGASQLYTVGLNFDVIVAPQSGASFQILDGSSPDRFFWSTFTTTVGDFDYFYYLLGVEDKAPNSDEDFTDLVFAVGFSLHGDFQPGVPEPSTYGLAGAALLGGLIWRMRRRRA